MSKYDHKSIEPKWQEYWRKNELYQADDESDKEKRYILGMFPYPSGSGLHMGHMMTYTPTDIYSRYLRMNNYEVLHPIGWDAFGLPAENYAIKTGIHPRESTNTAIETFKKQLTSAGFSFDWSREVGTHDPEYYKWTQWFFLTLYNNGLAYKATETVNWCESCKTVLAREQVEGGECERCGSKPEQKELEQWFFKITDYADRLLEGLDKIDWPESTKTSQRNWIGRSEGGEIRFLIKETGDNVPVFTTRPDTIYGATYLVLAPEHEMVSKLYEKIDNKDEVENYVESAKKKQDLERVSEDPSTSSGQGKTGVQMKGVSAVNPATGEEISVFIADYVLTDYGTGAIMAVPAHDERDYAFAEKHDLEVRQVVQPPYESGEDTLPYTGEGVLVNSGEFTGEDSVEAKEKITKYLGGEMKTTYRLRNWLISRQRYWGAPIPIVYDPEGNPHPVPEEHLPWLLPDDVSFNPIGIAPLTESQELQDRVESIFGKGWKPEVDTMDTFVCSSWYYFRYTDPHNDEEFASRERMQEWLPVDLYVGGAEHAVMHLLYARFFTKVLYDLGYVDFDEPFSKLRHQGVILAEDGTKMSKSKGNVVNPDEEIDRYGADTVRMFQMFLGPLEDSKPWDSKNLIGVRRFLERVWRLQEKADEESEETNQEDISRLRTETEHKVRQDIENLKFNTAISQLMIFVNSLQQKKKIPLSCYEDLLKMLAPFAPHITEELWYQIGKWNKKGSVHCSKWPPTHKIVVKDHISINDKIAIQINGKVRAEIEVEKDTSEDEVFEMIPQHIMDKWVGDKEIKKKIYVPCKIFNIVVEE